MNRNFDRIEVGTEITGPVFAPTRQTIKDFCEASYDHNPLHLDDRYMEGSFGKTQFGGIIMHGMSHFSLMSRMLNDWLMPRGGVHKRLETRWLIPVKPGDTIQPTGRVKLKRQTKHGCFLMIDIVMTNQRSEIVARGESMAEFPPAAG
ncbi:MAG: MaoC family dehydratase [Burkholderiales bacterium]|nr:MaoC family dehydratase [Burkholderiales bacterium]